MRSSERKYNQMRPIKFEIDYTRHAEGSCLVRIGDTVVLCTASIEDRLPIWLRGSGFGWVSAEYALLPRATAMRNRRESVIGKQAGRSQEIQRFIGRGLRAGVDRILLGQRQILIDCDVLQADGGTRCAATTGGWVALHLAVNTLMRCGDVKRNPLKYFIAAVSCGLYDGEALLDLDYAEDNHVDTDANFIMTSDGALVEIQSSAERKPFTRKQFECLLNLAQKGIGELIAMQKSVLDS